MKLRLLGTSYRPYDARRFDGFSPSLLIDGTVLIDPTEDALRFAQLYAMHDLLDKVDTVIITHAHPSHVSPALLTRLADTRRIRVYATEAVCAMLAHIPGLLLIPLYPFVSVRCGAYRLTPLTTQHTTSMLLEIALNLHIEDGAHALFYGLDGGELTEDTRAYLRAHPVDAMLLDGAYGDTVRDVCHEHLTLSAAQQQLAQAREEGLLRGRCYAMLTNLPPFADAQQKYIYTEKAKSMGFLLPYDGYFVEV